LAIYSVRVAKGLIDDSKASRSATSGTKLWSVRALRFRRGTPLGAQGIVVRDASGNLHRR
jgi:hypothetical protein